MSEPRRCKSLVDLYGLLNKSSIETADNKSSSGVSTADSDSGYLNSDMEEMDKVSVSECLLLPAFATATNRTILSGYSGRAKNDSSPTIQTLNHAAGLRAALTLNYGDDVGLICRKQLAIQGCHSYSKCAAVHLLGKHYFALADGVSANRARGYDAKLFPNALIDACARFIGETDEDYLNYQLKQKCGQLREQELINKLMQDDSNEIEQVTHLLNDYKFSDEFDEEEEEEEEECDDDEDQFFNEADMFDQEVAELEENDCERLRNILAKAHDLAQQQLVYGSSTMCLLSLQFFDTSEYSLLSSCNIGDSGYMLIRDKKVLYKSQTQSHRYNAPYQLGCTPPELIEHNLYRDR